jgi:hypothetical protein
MKGIFMNKWIIGGTLVAASLMANAETFAVHVVKPLTAGTTMVPVGDYTLATMKGNPSVFLLEGQSVRLIVFGTVARPFPDAKPTVELHSLKIANPKEEPVKLASSK